MALEFGSVFDVYLRPGDIQWEPGHKTHDRGKSVDFRCKPPHKINSNNSVIYDKEIIERFLQICRLHGLRYADHEEKGTDNEHIHCGTNRSGT